MNHWLMKCEPAAYTIDDLERDGVTSWEGVRNFQARNFMRAMRAGDGVLFYASNADPSGVTGLAEVAREAYPDSFSWKKGHKYFDPKSTPEKPIWFMVDIRFVRKFPRTISIDELRQVKALEKMVIL
ncbi:MAG TPA: EVE domain-containing protein, partial [Thermoanaerobaculia bacterium]|nr:EVE domain-containing protein [Thermoanaerobaculia bacterium]